MRIINLNSFRDEENQWLLIPETRLEKFLLWVLGFSKLVNGKWVHNLTKPYYRSLIVVQKPLEKHDT